MDIYHEPQSQRLSQSAVYARNLKAAKLQSFYIVQLKRTSFNIEQSEANGLKDRKRKKKNRLLRMIAIFRWYGVMYIDC